MNTENDGETARKWYKHKSALMEVTLGKQHPVVTHCIFAFEVGGALDLYYYPNALAGTAIATQELSEKPNEGPSNRFYRSYELVMFTRHQLDLAIADDMETEFGRAHENITRILNPVARYSTQAALNPNDTFEFSSDMENVAGKCLIFADFASHSDSIAERFGLLAVIEIFRSEMNFARRDGGAQLIQRLKDKGHYPFSDMDRDLVA